MDLYRQALAVATGHDYTSVDVAGEPMMLAVAHAQRVSKMADEIDRLKKIEEMARFVLEKFQKDEAQGYHTRDREFAISLLAKGFEMASASQT
jgi:hypothetical protein